MMISKIEDVREREKRLRSQIIHEREQKETAVSQVNELLSTIQDRHRKVLVRIREEKVANELAAANAAHEAALAAVSAPSSSSIDRTHKHQRGPSMNDSWSTFRHVDSLSSSGDIPTISVHNSHSNMSMMIPSIPVPRSGGPASSSSLIASSVTLPTPLTPQTAARRRSVVSVDKIEYDALHAQFVKLHERLLTLESWQETALQAADSWNVERKQWQHQLNDMTLKRHIAKQDQGCYNLILKAVLASTLVKVELDTLPFGGHSIP
jgi:hypothetical protein